MFGQKIYKLCGNGPQNICRLPDYASEDEVGLWSCLLEDDFVTIMVNSHFENLYLTEQGEFNTKFLAQN